MTHRELLRQLIKEEVRRVLLEYLRGEWWLDDSGQSMYADQDVGDMGHEGYVLERVVNEILEFFGVFVGELRSVELSDYYNDIEEALTDKGELADPIDVARYEDDPGAFILDYMVKNGYENAEEVYKMANGQGDAREYAIRNWGWKRVAGGNVETQTLTAKDLRAIVRGLYDAYEGELSGYAEMGEDEPTFNIEVRANRTYFSDVPWSVLDAESPSALMPYRQTY